MSRAIYFTIDSALIVLPPDIPPPSSNVLFDTLLVDLPSEFIYSNNKKFVSVNNARCINIESNAYDVFGASCCSNIIQDNPYGDFFLTFCNDNRPFIKKLQIYDSKTKFNIWFKDAKGKVIDLDPRKHRIVMELYLEF
jgi:hypothetical protein